MANPSEHAVDPAIDLDEDLFDFDEVMGSRLSAEEEEADLDEIFAAFDDAAEAATDRLDHAADPAPQVFDAPHPPPVDAATHDAPDEEAEELFALDEPQPSAQARPEPVFEPEPEVLRPPSRRERQPAPPAPLPAPAAAAAAAASARTTPHAPAAAAGARGRSAGGMRGALWILVAVTAMNSLVAMVALKASGDTRDSMFDLGRELSQSAQRALQASEDQAPAGESTKMPVAAPDADAHPTFELAREEIARGEYAKARQRLYALLAIVDRLDPLVREEVEARANYVLAEALHLEAIALLEAER